MLNLEENTKKSFHGDEKDPFEKVRMHEEEEAGLISNNNHAEILRET